VRLQHLAGDLGIPRLISSDETQLIAAEDRHQAIQQK